MPGLRDGRTRPSTLTIVMFPLDLLGLTFFFAFKGRSEIFSKSSETIESQFNSLLEKIVVSYGRSDCTDGMIVIL